MSSKPCKLTDALQNPVVRLGRSGRAECVATYMFLAFLTHEFAWKIKKPVAFDFLVFSTLPQRKRFCEEKQQLNRRDLPSGSMIGIGFAYSKGTTSGDQKGLLGVTGNDVPVRLEGLLCSMSSF